MNNDLVEYIDKLTGIAGVQFKDLTSAQKARVISWARSNSIELDVSPVSAKHNIDSTSMVIPQSKSEASSINIGLDAQHKLELFPAEIPDLKSNIELLNIFTLAEIVFAESKVDPLLHLTGIFASKEAYMKATSCQIDDLSQIEISHDDMGRPMIDGCSLSISYSQETAYAVLLFKGVNVSLDPQISTTQHGVIDIDDSVSVKNSKSKLILLIAISFLAGFFCSEFNVHGYLSI